jgi:integrase
MRRNFQVLDITQQLSTEQIQQRQDKLQNLYVVPTHKNTPNTVHLRDGEVVLYKRERSSVWQARFRLYDKKWHSVSTKHYNLEFASRAACEIYDEARFRERMGVSHTRRRFDTIAKATIKELEAEAEAGIKPMTNKDYIRVINKYFIPFFGHRYLENINGEHMREYEIWRNTLMKKAPLASTLATHSSAYNRIIGTAVQRGWVSAQVPLAHISRRGAKGKARPAFSRNELDYLLDFLADYSQGGHSALAKEMRLLSRDYIELLAATGMRSGKESLNIKWKHIEWYVDTRTGKRYLRIWVTGKTGARYLIAKNRAEEGLQRLMNRESLFSGLSLDEVLAKKYDVPVFRLSDGTQPKSFHTTFIWLMKASGLLKDSATNQNRTLYSLRHTYATLAMTEGNMDMHTLAKQMGTSVGMLERHYSKLTATMAAEKLA